MNNKGRVRHIAESLLLLGGREDLLVNLAKVGGARTVLKYVADLMSYAFRRPPQMRFKYLADVHARRNAERVEHYLDRSAIGQVRHLFFGKYARDDALVSVTARHLIAHRKLALHGDKDFDHFDNARRKLIALLQLLDVLVMKLFLNFDLPLRAPLDLADLAANV